MEIDDCESTKEMSDLSAIILTFNEEIHIERCIRSIKPIVKNILVIDSFSTDGTVEIAKSLGATVVERKWKNYSDQFQWGLENLNVETNWIMRMDADEYLETDLQKEIPTLVETASDEILGIYFKRKVVFQGKWIKYGGTYPQTLLRIWRTGSGNIEQRWMDEHIVLSREGTTIIAKGNLVDDNLKGISFWINKHNSYATREAIDLLNLKYHFLIQDESLLKSDDKQARSKRVIKERIYSRLPKGFRAFLYFLYRYFFLLGFLDGSEGFTWIFMQAFWYRFLVDLKVSEIEKKSKGDPKEIVKFFHDIYGLSL